MNIAYFLKFCGWLKIMMFLTALYFQPFSLSFLRFLSKYATFYAVNPTVTHLIL